MMGINKKLLFLRKSSLLVFKWWCLQESNQGHKDFQSFALPTELWHHHVFTTHTLAIIVAISELRCKGSAFI